MALFHLSVTQTKRSAGQSAIASAAYRAGERLYSEYYGEYSDYTRKGGVICSDILLPSHAPKEYADRQTLWNAVEKAERGKTAQLAYSFDIALQNEFSLEENIALARQFLLEQFVSRGMVVDFAVHQPDREDGGIPNPHFHVLCPIRPIEQNGKWGCKQHRVYELDEDGNRIRDADGNFVFNAVPTTDWGSPETLEYWRQTWAELCNAKFAEKGLDVSIDHRSYERQGVELLPTVHEGATVRAMEKKGIRTEKGEFNRWIKATNAVIRDIKKKITSLMGWIADMKAELAKPQAPDLVSLLNAYYTQRKAGAYSQKGKISNLKEMNDTFNYLRANGIYSLEDLERRVSEHSAATESLKKTLDEQTARMKAIKQLYDSSAAFQSLKPVYDGLQKIKFEKPRAKYKAEHETELKQFYAARRKLTGEFPDGKVDMKKLTEEYDELEQAHETTYGEFNRWIRATNAVIRDIKKKIALLFDWIAEAKAELAKPQAPNLVSLLNAYYTSRRAGAYSQKGKVSNLKEMNETFNYLRANGIYSLEDLEHRVSEHSAATESLKKTLDEQTARMKAIKQLYDSSAAFQSLKPVYDGLQKTKFEKPRAKYKAEHEAELKQFYAARRKLTGEFPDGKVDMKKLSAEYDELEQAHETTYGEFKTVRDDLHRLWRVKSCVDTAARFNEHTEEQKLQNRPQTRHKKEDMTR